MTTETITYFVANDGTRHTTEELRCGHDREKALEELRSTLLVDDYRKTLRIPNSWDGTAQVDAWLDRAFEALRKVRGANHRLALVKGKR